MNGGKATLALLSVESEQNDAAFVRLRDVERASRSHRRPAVSAPVAFELCFGIVRLNHGVVCLSGSWTPRTSVEQHEAIVDIVGHRRGHDQPAEFAMPSPGCILAEELLVVVTDHRRQLS